MLDPLFHLLETLLEHDSIMSVRAAIEQFIAGAKEPCALEPGQEPIPLAAGQYEVSEFGGRVVLQAWSRDTNMVRRIVSCSEAAQGRLELEVERFGKKAGSLLLVDRAHPKAEAATRRSGRLVFREWFRRALSRHFAGWRLREISAEPDLEHSLSPSYVRAFAAKGAAGWAAIGAAPECADPDGALAFGLIWLDYLRRREPRIAVEGLAIFLPEGRERVTCLRVRCLDSRIARYAVFVYGTDGWEQQVDLADAGNLDSELPAHDTHFDVPAWTARFSSIAGVESLPLAGGDVSWRARGLEFARWNGKELRYGIDSRAKGSERDAGEVAMLAQHVLAARSANAANTANPIYMRSPERWLESEIRRRLRAIDAALLDEPVYGQVPSFAGSERGILDLLACGYDGRLCVIEVKASEDPQLPLQALDYWMRVRLHAARQEFGVRGYFPGIAVAVAPPRMILIAPALSFHSTTETVLRFLSSEIEVICAGVAMNWRSELKVVFRAVRCEDRTEDTRNESCASADAGAGRDRTLESP